MTVSLFDKHSMEREETEQVHFNITALEEIPAEIEQETALIKARFVNLTPSFISLRQFVV